MRKANGQRARERKRESLLAGRSSSLGGDQEAKRGQWGRLALASGLGANREGTHPRGRAVKVKKPCPFSAAVPISFEAFWALFTLARVLKAKESVFWGKVLPSACRTLQIAVCTLHCAVRAADCV